jgi:uncharacterized protein (TIGR02145 family)
MLKQNFKYALRQEMNIKNKIIRKLCITDIWFLINHLSIKKVVITILSVLMIITAGCKKENENITVTDYEGNIYKTVKLGRQLWMAENLRSTRFNDGTEIANITDGLSWGDPSATTPAYCWYNNDSVSFMSTYGALYNYYAVKTSKLCPTGWHVSSDDEWTTMIALFGTPGEAGGKLCETGNLHWQSIINATNESGFTALPGGRRYINYGAFLEMGKAGYWWTSTPWGSFQAYYRGIYPNMGVISGWVENGVGYSVRCVKD